MKFFLCMLISCFFLVGCNSQKTLKNPKVDPLAAAAMAMKAYDSDSDGKISAAEAKRTALDPKNGWDSNGDGGIDETEIVNRLTTYDAMKPGLQMNITCTVIYNRKPLVGAEVVYEPEPFLGGSVPVATGTTDEDGIATMVAKEIADPSLQGMYTGLYLVRITHPDVEVAANYNTETELFVELSPMDMQTQSPTFRLKK